MMSAKHTAESAEKLAVAPAAMATAATRAGRGSGTGRRRRARGRSTARMAREETRQLAAEREAKRMAGAARCAGGRRSATPRGVAGRRRWMVPEQGAGQNYKRCIHEVTSERGELVRSSLESAKAKREPKCSPKNKAPCRTPSVRHSDLPYSCVKIGPDARAHQRVSAFSGHVAVADLAATRGMRIRSIAAVGAVKLEESSVGVLPNVVPLRNRRRYDDRIKSTNPYRRPARRAP